MSQKGGGNSTWTGCVWSFRLWWRAEILHAASNWCHLHRSRRKFEIRGHWPPFILPCIKKILENTPYFKFIRHVFIFFATTCHVLIFTHISDLLFYLPSIMTSKKVKILNHRFFAVPIPFWDPFLTSNDLWGRHLQISMTSEG